MGAYVYLIEYETDVSGVWSSPENLVRDCFDVDPRDDTVEYEGKKYTVSEFGKFLVEEARDPYFSVRKAELDKGDLSIDH